MLLGAESPEANIEGTVSDGTPEGIERGQELRSDWQSVSHLLRLASAIDAVEISDKNLDPWKSSDHCEPAAAYGDVQHLILRPYFTALARFQLVWNAYELIRQSSSIGRTLLRGTRPSSPLCSFEYFPFLRAALVAFDETWIAEPHPIRDQNPPMFLSSKALKKIYSGQSLAWCGMTLNEYRNYIFHGDEEPPNPDDSFDHFGGKPPLRVPIKTARMDAASTLAMVMILVFSSDWMPAFYAATTAEDESLYLVEVDYSARDPRGVLLQLTGSVLARSEQIEPRSLL